MSVGHSHGDSQGAVRAGHERALWIALGLTTSFMVVEIVAALITRSRALLSDAAHMFTDSAALVACGDKAVKLKTVSVTPALRLARRQGVPC